MGYCLQKTDGQRTNMAEFLHTYLKQRFSLPQMVVEWGYNVHDACERYSHDNRIGLFWHILSGEVTRSRFYVNEKIIVVCLL
jgi:hypothetical protein